MDNTQKRLLRELANCYGVQTAYYDVFRQRQNATNSTLLNILKSLHAPIETARDLPHALHQFNQDYFQQKISPVLIAWQDALTTAPLHLTQQEALSTIHCRLVYEDGSEHAWEVDMSTLPALNTLTFDGNDFSLKAFEIPGQLPLGYHQLFIQTHKHQLNTLIISAPKNVYRANQHSSLKKFGLFTPIYALHSQRSMGCGDLTDFKHFITWSKQQGSHFISTTPLHAGFLAEPCEFSPYSPISRLFWNEFYLDLSAIAEFSAVNLPQQEIAQLNALPTVAYKKIMALKRQLLTTMCNHCLSNPTRRSAFEHFLNSHTEAKNYCAFRANGEIRQQLWHLWPENERNGQLPKEIFNTDHYYYHGYVQWQIHEQLNQLIAHAKKNDTLLYLDTPLGVHPQGFDTWRFQADFPRGATAGAPPDSGFPQGQNWGIAPLHPIQIRKSQYQYYIQCLKTIMPQHDLLRLDHVMSLHRLYFIPENCSAQEGAYVRYPAEELYAILSLESHRYRVNLIGENLGTVPNHVNQMMKKHHINLMYVLQYELDSDHTVTHNLAKHCIASLNTHDMPTFAAYLQGLDIAQRINLGLLKKSAQKLELQQRQDRLEKLIAQLLAFGLIKTPQDDYNQSIVFNSLIFLATQKQLYLSINIEDLWLETQQQNTPSLPADENGNWQHKHHYALESFTKNTNILWILAQIAKARGKNKPSTIKLLPKLPVTYHNLDSNISLISNDDIYLFNEGNHFRLYDKLGAHYLTRDGQEGVYFAVWAPNAQQVSVIGDFNGWHKHSHPLQPRNSSGIWEGFISGLKPGCIYKYFIVSNHHQYQVEKADPFGFYHEIPPKTASIVNNLHYDWQDEDWLQQRNLSLKKPMAIYEVHLGSWRRVPEDHNRSLSYREFASYLAEYVNMMGYTHVEFLPVMEHPFYDSWGYQLTGYFAPTSRYGTPEDFMYLVDYLHRHNIGVILDWVPSHFPYDQHGLAYFDGTSLFEHADPRQGFHPDWTSAIFNYGRNEVRSFLISSAMFWLDKYHIDGLRVDGVASMLYLDYSRKEGQWLPNKHGGRENLEAIYFLQRLNEAVYQHYPDIQTIAEESTSWGGVTKPTWLGGLGFGLKWDMGWMHDTLQYFAHEPIHRSYHQNAITFRMIYAFSENFMLPLSHDEVVHGKRSLLNKMPGTDWDKFANVRLLFGYMYAQPGKKMLFMGNDFGQWQEWNCHHSLDWHLLDYAPHQGLQQWVRTLNHLYRTEPALHVFDCDRDGFEWIDCNDANHSTLVFLRKAPEQEIILVVINATPMVWQNYHVGVPLSGKWSVIANSDDSQYGGSNNGSQGVIIADAVSCHGREFSLVLNLPPLGIIFLKKFN